MHINNAFFSFNVTSYVVVYATSINFKSAVILFLKYFALTETRLDAFVLVCNIFKCYILGHCVPGDSQGKLIIFFKKSYFRKFFSAMIISFNHHSSSVIFIYMYYKVILHIGFPSTKK